MHCSWKQRHFVGCAGPRSCLALQSLVANSERLIDLSRRLLGSRITNAAIKYTFFKHFCAGEMCLLFCRVHDGPANLATRSRPQSHTPEALAWHAARQGPRSAWVSAQASAPASVCLHPPTPDACLLHTGETREEVQATAARLRACGVGAILDYAAEDDVGSAGQQVGNKHAPTRWAIQGHPPGRVMT